MENQPQVFSPAKGVVILMSSDDTTELTQEDTRTTQEAMKEVIGELATEVQLITESPPAKNSKAFIGATKLIYLLEKLMPSEKC